MTEMVAPEVKAGDIFVCSWGYDQTNVDFYKVISRTAKSVRVQPWEIAYEDKNGPHDSVVAGGGPVMENDWSDVTPEMDRWTAQQHVKQVPAPIVTRRLKVWGSTPHFTVNSYSSASLWDGSAQYQTGQGYGH